MRLAGATRAEILRALAEIGVPERELKMRASQLWHWIYHRGAREFSAMRNIARPLLDRLAERFTLERPEIVAEQVSADGTRKWLLRFAPARRSTRAPRSNASIFRNPTAGTLCVSSQVGCTLNCSLLPYRHDAARAQSDGGRDRRPGSRRPRPARRFSGRGSSRQTGSRPRAKACARCRTSSSWAWANRSTISTHVRDAIAVLADGDGLVALEAAHHRLDLRRRARDDTARRRMRDHARGLAARDQRRAARRARAAQPEISDRSAHQGLPRLSRRLERAAHHFRICDAEGRQRFGGRGQRARAAAQGRCPPRSTSSPSIPGPEARSSARTGRRSSASRTSSSTPATPAPCARRAAATFSPPAASSRARAKNCAPALA